MIPAGIIGRKKAKVGSLQHNLTVHSEICKKYVLMYDALEKSLCFLKKNHPRHENFPVHGSFHLQNNFLTEISSIFIFMRCFCFDKLSFPLLPLRCCKKLEVEVKHPPAEKYTK